MTTPAIRSSLESGIGSNDAEPKQVEAHLVKSARPAEPAVSERSGAATGADGSRLSPLAWLRRLDWFAYFLVVFWLTMLVYVVVTTR